MKQAWMPLVFRSVYKDYIWGGTRLATQLGRADAPARAAESWEVADHADGQSVVAAGPLAGQTLRDLCQAHGVALLGTVASDAVFPLLIKLIDARECLSVQVHPDDAAAARFGGQAKTEMWYALEGTPDAQVYAGFQPGVTDQRLRAALRDNRVAELLRRVPTPPDSAVLIPGGLVHAIDAGCLLLEIQQNSNTTYRLYDWGRVGPNGQPRALHLEEALRVIGWDLAPAPGVPKPLAAGAWGAREEIAHTPYFRLERWALRQALDWAMDPATFQVLFVRSGACRLTWGAGDSACLPAGRTVLLPAALSNLRLEPVAPATSLLRISDGRAGVT